MKLKVEIADSPSTLSRGLMYRKSLSEDAGMLFIFKRPQELSFWGDNTYIPLDIAFIDRDHTIRKISQIHPMDKTPVRSEADCYMALEANKGFFSHYEIEVGDDIRLLEDRFDGPVVRFSKNYEGRVKNYNERNSVVRTAQWGAGVANNVEKPQNFDDPMHTAIEQLQQDVSQQVGNEETERLQQDEVLRQQNAHLPEVDPDHVSLADDDNEQEGKEPEAPQTMEDLGNLPEEEAEKQPGSESEETDEEAPSKDEYGGSIIQAINDFPPDAGWEMTITYVPKPKPRKLGPVTASPTLQRMIQPHGHKSTQTTFNDIIVCWDETVSDYRAFISTQVMDWDFTGRSFKKWFRIKV